MARVSPEWAEGYACPRCGRPLRWIGSWRHDRNSPDGWSFERETHTWDVAEKVSREDRKVTKVVSRNGYEGRTVTRWEHVCQLRCARCGVELAPSQAHRMPAPSAADAPAGYYVLEG